MPPHSDFYTLDPQHIKDPPTSFFQKLKFLGPGFILSASIVGSGELIATTTLGARAGFVALWIILISCVVKVALQLEFAKYTIIHGVPAMKGFDQLHGKRLGKAHWTVWAFLVLMIIKFTQLGGIIGGVAITLNIAMPGLSITLWAIMTALIVAALVFVGRYALVEKVSILMIGIFTLMTFTSLYFIQFTDFSFGWKEIASGFSLHLPPEIIAVAIGAFGITGVGGDEIIHYTYWCMEKGYAAHAGPNDGTAEWKKRAKGWINIMKLDAILAMLVYTIMTAAFYLLGAAILHGAGDVPQGFGLIESLSRMYTETLGPEAKTAFLFGAVIVLFSTLFSALAAWTRQYTDIFSLIGWIDFKDAVQRNRSIGILAWVIPMMWLLIFLFVQMPVMLVIFGGIITSVILLFIVYAAIHFRYRQTPDPFLPKWYHDAILGVSITTIIGVAFYGVYQLMF